MNSKHDKRKNHGHGGERHGAKQPSRFDPARAAMLDAPERFEYLPPAEIVSMLEAPQRGCVVDFGTGVGVYAIEIARRRPDLKVIAFDEQPEMLDMLRAKPAARELENLSPVLSRDAASLSGKADRILALNVLHELGDEAMRQMVAMLKRDGSILFIDWDAGVERPVGPPRDHTYSANEALKRIESFGLAAERGRAMRYHFVFRARRAPRN
jgi:SAM-dependent methyltransferase